MPERRQDPQDKQFGAQARRDAEVVDQLEEEGVHEDELSDNPSVEPRAGDKAEPQDRR
ncbi:MAG: hypothetical protein ACRDYZ_01555 [Acidimicrobiales bacterium]